MSSKQIEGRLVENNKPLTFKNAKKPTDLSMLKLMKAKSATTNMGANQKASGQTPSSKTTKATTTTDNSKLIKKAYVRFDDYLDLNEENMRRSCKRLMNHLYSESNSTAPPLPIAAAPTITCQSSLGPPTGAGASLPIKSSTASKNSNGISNRSLPPTPLQQEHQQQQQQQQQATGKGKSYLRSQYERRQLRQMELMQQQQQQFTEANDCEHEVDGANARRQQQDLVVAKSHELSKRRFFEKLERRELIKNSNSASNRCSNNLSTHATEEHAIKQEMGAPRGPTSFRDQHRLPLNRETSNRQKELAAAKDDQIMLEVYGSIVPNSNKNNNTAKQTRTSTPTAIIATNKQDTLEQLAGTQVMESTGELIGFYTPSPNSPAACCSVVVALGQQKQEERLIEFSASTMSTRCCRECSTLVAADQSAFEIKVPEVSSSSTLDDENDGFPSSGLLVVKQVEVAAELDRVCDGKSCGEQQDEEPPLLTLCGRHKEETSSFYAQLTTAKATLAQGNKTKTPHADEVELEICSKVSNATPQKQANNNSSSSSSINPSETMAENSDDSKPSIAGSDNKQHQADISPTISSGSNDSNKMKKISPSEASGRVEQAASQTTGRQDGSLEAAALSSTSSPKRERAEEEEETAAVSQIEAGRPVCIDVCGASNRSEDHEAPETAMLPIGQSAGAKESPLAGVDAGSSTLYSVNSAYPVGQTQSAALMQQVASLQTTITKLPVRDVPPEASGINPMEAIVSEKKNDANSTRATNGDDEKVIVAGKQVNEEQHGGSNRAADGYANPVFTSANQDASEALENNVNHDVVRMESLGETEKEILSSGANIDLMGENKHLIEPFKIVQYSKQAAQRTSSSHSQSATEEDGGSSCSSSGFGASVSVTSSLDGSNSINDTVTANGLVKRQQVLEQFRRPTSLALVARCTNQSFDCAKLYDTVRIPKQDSTRSRPALDFPGYKELVGPDQAYPSSRGVALLVENDSYASVLDRNIHSHSDGFPSRLDASIVLENDEGLLEGYANLPRSKASPVEYATVCAPSSEQHLVNNKKKPLDNVPSEASSLSGHSYSASSANSGGFSALSPAQAEQNCSSGNNFESLVSLSSESTQKKSSLLKRFGSLVSKAFNGAANAQSVTPKINESPSTDDHSKQQQQENNANACSKSALVIEGDHQVAAEASGQVNEADLVILPTKSSVNQQQRKLNVPLAQHQQNQNAARRTNDDRLSRDRRRSRKLKQQQQTDSSSVAFTSSTFSSSELSSGARHFSGERQTKLKRADSLSEELESLMSRSTDEQSNNQRGAKDFRKIIPKRPFSSSRHEPLSLTSGCIDIDCVSPTTRLKETKLNKVVSGEPLSLSGDKSASPRSLLRLFYPTSSQRTLNSGELSKPQNFRRQHQSSLCHKTSAGEATKEQVEKLQQPISGFWGYSSLIGQSHATTDNLDSSLPPATKSGKKPNKSKVKPNSGNSNDEDHDSLMYSNMRPFTAGYRLHPSSRTQQAHELHPLDEHSQSLGVHQTLLRKRNYRHHHHHHHHHHHRKHHLSPSTSRHAHYSAPSTKCSQPYDKNCHASSCSEDSTCCGQDGGRGKPVVWGQLIKINKSDGSQVIELQRSPGKSWGFFVARGAINHVKGIFISRMHDTATSNSLTGLLSIGDCILAIDELPIEPDYDILRVNQMISKKSKILLKVKPFKG